MFLKYCLAAFIVIVLTASCLFVSMRKHNLMNKQNKVNLIVSTVLALVCAIIIPLLAKLMVQRLYFSISVSVVLSFIICFALTGVLYLYLKNHFKLGELQEQIIPDEGAAPENISAADGGAPIETLPGEALPDVSVPSESMPVEALANKEEPEQSHTPGDSEKQKTEYTSEVVSEPLQDIIPEAAEAFEEAAPAESADITTPESPTLSDLLDEAYACKNNHELKKSIFLYEAALLENPEPELLQWIVVDLCTLYKMTNQKELAYKTLESEHSNLLNNQIKEDILRNI